MICKSYERYIHNAFGYWSWLSASRPKSRIFENDSTAGYTSLRSRAWRNTFRTAAETSASIPLEGMRQLKIKRYAPFVKHSSDIDARTTLPISQDTSFVASRRMDCHLVNASSSRGIRANSLGELRA